MRLHRCCFLASIIVALSGCATAPVPIPAPPVSNPPLAQVHANPSDYRGLTARWGGTIIEVENREQETVLLIMGRPLDDEGMPQVEAASPGRFMAKIKGFLDPVIYSPGRLVTVAGTIVGSESRKIGSYSYRYPVLAGKDYYLWPKLPQAVRYNTCYTGFCYGSPFYPWYGVGYAGRLGYGWW
ncbi:MAG: Slp family lipoprotein [Nitrococcus sp.]|nr:Slp family lipoprotein [Nitrococcus sp.]